MVILYNSYSGFSYKYASLLAKALDLPLYSISNASKINKAEDVIFFTCINNDKIMELNLAKRFDLALVCVVGGMPYSTSYLNKLKEINKINEFYYFEGGISLSSIGYFSRIKLNLKKRSLNKKLKNKTISFEEKVFLDKINNNDDKCDYSSIKLIIEWYLNHKENNFVS